MSEAVRLVIWDLDETFWRGTLTEGGIEAIPENEEIVRTLARRGILSAICSKNDPEDVKAILVERGIWDMFVFPSINWEPKGQRVADLIEAVQLRPQSVLMIDDNPMNLREASRAVPDLQTADETILAGLLDDPRLAGKDDAGLTRLAQYKLLEARHGDEKRAGTGNLDFLRESGIQVTFEYDLVGHADRAIELINRTNQLNFTKSRLPDDRAQARAAYLALVGHYDVKGALIRVRDRYGDYGIVGLYLIRGRRSLVQFCFSCRILHMGVEDWVFDAIGRPSLDVTGEVVTDLFRDRPAVDWIAADATQAPVRDRQQAPRLPSVRARGGCDLEAITHYLRPLTPDLLLEGNVSRWSLPIRLDHSSMLRLALITEDPQTPPEAIEARWAALEPLGLHPDDVHTRIFRDAAPGSAFVFSNWADAEIYVYRHRALGFTIPFHLPDRGRSDLIATPDADLAPNIRTFRAAMALDHLRRHFEFVGYLPEAEIVDNLRFAFARIPAGSRMFALLSNETTYTPQGAPFTHPGRVRLNACLREAAAGFAQVTLLDVAQFIEDRSEVQTVSHFDREVYFRVAAHIAAVMDSEAAATPMAA